MEATAERPYAVLGRTLAKEDAQEDHSLAIFKFQQSSGRQAKTRLPTYEPQGRFSASERASYASHDARLRCDGLGYWIGCTLIG